MQVVEIEKLIEELLNDYYSLESNIFSKKLEKNFRVFEEIEEIKTPRTKAVSKFLYSIGLSMLSSKLQSYKIYETRLSVNQRAYQAIEESLEFFKDSEEYELLEHIYDHLIYLLWQRIPFEFVIVDERLKLLQKLIDYCKKQEEISSKLGDKAFLTSDERIPYRYTIGEFRYLLEKATLSKEEAIDSNEQLKAKIEELAKFDFPKAKFWARKWSHKHACNIEGNKQISFYGGTLIVDGDDVEFRNDSFNRSIKFKMYIDPSTKISTQSAYPEAKIMRTRIFFSTLNPKIERRYDDGLKLDYILENPARSREDAFERENFSIVPQKSEKKDYILVIETTGEVDAQEHATMITERDVSLRVNDPALEVTKNNGITTIKFNLIKKISGTKGPRSSLPEKEEMDYLGYGRSIKFTLYCNINPTFSGTYIFSDPSNWKYCLAASLYMNKLKYKKDWYPNFLNFDFSPILFLEDGNIPLKLFNKPEDGESIGFLKDTGREFPGLLKHIVIFGDFMGDRPLEDRKTELMNLIHMIASISHLAIDEKSVIQIITSNKQYYEEMFQIEAELNKINEKLTRIYKSTTATAIDIEYIQPSEFISNANNKNRKIVNHDFEEVYLVENPILAFALVPLVKYTQSAILSKDELKSEQAQKILKKAKQIWAIGDFKGVKIPKKASTKLTLIQNNIFQKDVNTINEIFRGKIEDDFKSYMDSNYLQRIYPGHTEKDLLNNCILTSFSEEDYSFLTLASNYATNKPATMTIIQEDDEFKTQEKNIISKLKDLRFTETKSVEQKNLNDIGAVIKDSLHILVQKEIEGSENIILLTKIPIPFELYSYNSNPICISKGIGRVCSTDIIDTSIMLTLNMMRQMIMKSGEKILIMAPKYDGDYALPDAINEANTLSKELEKIFKDKTIKKIDEVIDKEWIFKILKEPLKIIHFSGHGFYTDNKSCLILSASADKAPVFLFSDDLEQFVTNSGPITGYPLVFTSACITGQIQEAGSGLEGLASQFIKSGATCFIGTLWEIMDDSAREFATHLYGSLNELDKNLGDIILESRQLLHEKSLKMLKNGEYFDPTGYAFILFGDPTIKIK